MEFDVERYNDYYPFGALLPGRSGNSSEYRYGVSGMEMDNEVYNTTGTSYDFGARIYNPRLGRWLTCDPQSSRYPSHSSYNYVANSPMKFIDPDGEKVVIPPGSQESVMGYFNELGLGKAYRINKRGVLRVNRLWVLTHRKEIMRDPNKRDVYKGINKKVTSVMSIYYVHVVDETPWSVTREKHDGVGPMSDMVVTYGGVTYSGGSEEYAIVGDGNLVLEDPTKQEHFGGNDRKRHVDIVINEDYIGKNELNAKDGGLAEPSAAATFVHLLVDKDGSVNSENKARSILKLNQRKGDDTNKDEGNYTYGVFVIFTENDKQEMIKTLEKQKDKNNTSDKIRNDSNN